MPHNTAQDDYYNVGEGPDWHHRFAYAAALLLNHPRDEHGRYADIGDKLAVVHEWLDEHGAEPSIRRQVMPVEDAHAAWMMVAFELSDVQWQALVGVVGGQLTDASLSRLLQKLLNAYLVQQYALPE